MPILWKPVKNLCSFLQFVNLAFSSILVERNSAFKIVHRDHIRKFILHIKLYLDAVERDNPL